MNKPENVISKIVNNSCYLTQRDNVNTLSEKRDKEPSNQCMIAAYGQWSIPFGYHANIEKWISQFKKETIEEVIHTIVMIRVNELNKNIKDPKKKTSRFTSVHFNWMFDQILLPYKWKMKSETATMTGIFRLIDSGQAVIVGTNISSFLPGASGHIQTFVGYYTDKNGKLLGFISNDPYGDCETGYKDHNGENRYYSIETTNKLLSPCNPGDVRLMIYAEKIK